MVEMQIAFFNFSENAKCRVMDEIQFLRKLSWILSKHLHFREKFLTQTFAKTFGETNIFAKICTKTNTVLSRNFSQKQIFSRKSATISPHQSIFTKMVSLFHLVLTSFAFFVINLSKSQHLLIFAKFFRFNPRQNATFPFSLKRPSQ